MQIECELGWYDFGNWCWRYLRMSKAELKQGSEGCELKEGSEGCELEADSGWADSELTHTTEGAAAEKKDGSRRCCLD